MWIIACQLDQKKQMSITSKTVACIHKHKIVIIKIILNLGWFICCDCVCCLISKRKQNSKKAKASFGLRSSVDHNMAGSVFSSHFIGHLQI